MGTTVYRDYGAVKPINGDATFPRNDVKVTQRRQVYQATHGGDGNRLPLMRRSFISFSYGGKWIEDFDLIASINGDRMQRDGYASFKDQTTEYDNLNGQQYWGTHYKTNTLEFNLATDGIDQKTLDDFLNWFSAGVSRELILSEHPNRAVFARVSSPPRLSLLPFEHQTIMTISGYEYPVTTTLYKGEITLQLTTDDPHWYAISNILGKVEETVTSDNQLSKRYVDIWVDKTVDPPREVDIFASQDALKILYEDGIPLGSMIENNMLLGNGAYASVEGTTDSQVWTPSEAEIEWTNGVPSGFGARIHGTKTEREYQQTSREIITDSEGNALYTESNEIINTNTEPGFIKGMSEIPAGNYVGVIAGAIVDVSGNGITELRPYQSGYFFYAGTAPAPTKISFSLHITDSSFNNAGHFQDIYGLITMPETPYNTITVESVTAQDLKITTPNLITSYNNAIEILQQNYFTMSIVNMRKEIIKHIKHPAVREWVIALLSDTETDTNVSPQTITDKMMAFFQKDDGSYSDMHFSFNSKTGEAEGTFSYREPTETISLFDFIYFDNAQNKYNTITEKDDLLDDQQRYENLVTWGWAQYCLDDNDEVIEPTEENPIYSEAVAAFIEYYKKCKKDGISIPGIFTARTSVLENSNMVTVTEDVGDMLVSNNIVLTERNYPNEFGKFVEWEDSEKGRRYSHRITHNLPHNLYNLQIEYKNMYL